MFNIISIREMQIKIIIIYHITLSRMAITTIKAEKKIRIEKDVLKIAISYIASGNVKWYSDCAELESISQC